MRAVEHDEQAQRLVAREAVLVAGPDEDGFPFFEMPYVTFDLDVALAVENDVDLIEVVWHLPVRFGSDQDVDADLEPR